MRRKGKKTENKRVPQSIDMIAGHNLRLLRCLRGYSQERLASEIGLTFQQIQKYENATNRMALSRAYQLASVLRVGIDAFFKETGSTQSVAPHENSGLNEWLSLFARAHKTDLVSELTALASRVLDNCESVMRSIRC
jgi:transcriptional regulator with XRE-family HTH domain